MTKKSKGRKENDLKQEKTISKWPYLSKWENPLIYDVVERAIAFATFAHAKQKRKYTYTPYIGHPLTVMKILQQVTTEKEILAAGVLHDVIEDCSIRPEKLERLFGRRVALTVLQVTKNSKGKDCIISREAAMVKIADILDNISTSPSKTYIKKKILALNKLGEIIEKKKTV